MTTDAQILSALRSASEGGVSGAELSQKLGISRAAIWARVEELRELGYDIEASPHLGYRLLSSPDALHADDLLDEGARTGKRVSIHVEKNNPALRLYERLGFAPIVDKGVYHLMERPVGPLPDTEIQLKSS